MEVLIAIRHTTSRSKMSTSTSISQALSRHADALSPEHISGRITIDHIHIHKKSIECTRLLWPPLDRALILDILPLFPSSAWPFLCCHQTSPSPKCANCKHWSTYRSGDELLIVGAGTDAKDCSTAGCNTAGLGHGHTGTCEGRLQRSGGHHRGGLLCTVSRVLPSKCAAEILVQMRPMSGADLTRAASLNRQPSFLDAWALRCSDSPCGGIAYRRLMLDPSSNARSRWPETFSLHAQLHGFHGQLWGCRALLKRICRRHGQVQLCFEVTCTLEGTQGSGFHCLQALLNGVPALPDQNRSRTETKKAAACMVVGAQAASIE